MRMPSVKQRRLLERAATKYQQQVQLASGYLGARGITREVATRWRLGVCSIPEPGHEVGAGRLVIPYLNRAGVMGLKFRCIQAHDCKAEQCPKYLAPLGQEAYLFNVLAVESDASTIHVTEGELDAVVLCEALAEPVVGVAGASVWKPHHPWHFRGFERVLVWGDGDKAGRDWARMLHKELSTAEVVMMPEGHDVNSLFVTSGAEALRKLAGDDGDD